MGQILSCIGVPACLQYILSTVFPSLLLINQLYYVCYVVNKQRDDAIHKTIILHQKKYFESLADVHKKLEGLDSDKKSLLLNLEDQKRLSEITFQQEIAFVYDSMRQNEYQLRVTNAALADTTLKMNSVYHNFTESSRKVSNKIRDLVAVDTILINKVERLEVANRSYVPASFKKAYQSLNIIKRSSTHAKQLNRTAYVQVPPAAAAPSVATSGSSVSVGANTSDYVRFNVPSNSLSARSKFKNTIRKKYTSKRASVISMVSTLKSNLRPRKHQSSSDDNPSDVSTTSSNNQPNTSSSTTSATTASRQTVESRIGSLNLAFSNQLKGIHSKIDRLASKVKKSKKPQQATTETHGAPESSSSSAQQAGDDVPLNLQVVILRDQLSRFYREFFAKEKYYKNGMTALYKDIAAVSNKQKKLDVDNRARWAAYEAFRYESQSKLGELFSRYEATTAFQIKKIADSEFNIEKLQDTTKRHQDSLASLAQTLEQETNEATSSFPDKSRATRATTTITTSVVLHEKQRREDQRLMEQPSASKFIHHMEGALKSDKAILDHNSKKLYALQQNLESSIEVENLKVQRDLVDREFTKALHQIAMIKKKIEPEFEYPPPLQQESEFSRAVNQRRYQFLRQYMTLHEQALVLNIKLMALCPGQLIPL